MAHAIETDGNRAAFVSSREDAWHGLGTFLPDTFTAEEAMKVAHLGGWDVRKLPLWITDDVTGQPVEVPGRAAVVRSNPFGKGTDVLGDVGRNYEIIQNEDHAALLNTLVDESGAHFETAGSLMGGRQVFITMKLPESMKIGGADPVDTYIAAMNSHDGSSSFTLMTTPVRVVCSNTLNYALSHSRTNTWRTRHTSQVEKNLRTNAREALDLTFAYLGEFQREADELVARQMTQSKFEEMISKEFGAGDDPSKSTVTRAENRLDEMMELFVNAGTQDAIRDTAWAGLNALTEWSDHFAPTWGEDKDYRRQTRAVLDPTFKTKAARVVRSYAGV